MVDPLERAVENAQHEKRAKQIEDLQLKITQRDCAISGQQRVIDDLTKKLRGSEAELKAALALNQSLLNHNATLLDQLGGIKE